MSASFDINKFNLDAKTWELIANEAAQAAGVHATAYALERMHAQGSPEITARDFEL